MSTVQRSFGRRSRPPEKHLAELPHGLRFPPVQFQARHRGRSAGAGIATPPQRPGRSSDNAIEAKASRIDVFFDQAKRQKGTKEGEAVAAVAFLDNGSANVAQDGSLCVELGRRHPLR